MEIKVLDFTGKWCSTCINLDRMLESEVIPKYKSKVKFVKNFKSIDEFKPEYVELVDYNPHPPIKAALSVSGGYYKSRKTTKP